jgi:uncharacterized protein YndB with AHSA1/START domain
MEHQMSESIEVSRVIPASPEAIYKAWLSGGEHGQMTGSTATYNDSDDTFTAWDGYIFGKTLEKQPHARILQSWRTTEFSEENPPSTLEVLLDPQGNGTLVTLKQSGLPAGQSASYQAGWEEHYFNPMTAHFQSTRAKLNEMGHAVSDAAEAATDAFEIAGEQVQKSAQQAVRSVKKTAKKASSAVKKLVAKAKKTLASRGAKKKKVAARKAAPKRKASKVKSKARPAPKKKNPAAKKKKKR